jgi:hypothetical protein
MARLDIKEAMLGYVFIAEIVYCSIGLPKPLLPNNFLMVKHYLQLPLSVTSI